MSEQQQSEAQKDPAEVEAQRPAKPKSNGGLQKALFFGAIGILIGYLIAQNATDFLPTILPVLMSIFIALFLLIIIAIIALPHILNYLAKRYTGQEVDVEQVVGDIQNKANHIADTVASHALAKADPEVRKNIRQDLPGILHYLVFSRLRNSGLRMLMTVFVAIGGLMGTVLLYQQNGLLSGQNEMLSSQNGLLLKQNEKIDNQILLDEASRRSSLNFLLGNVLDQVNDELKDPKNTKRRLSLELIGRIASLSQSFQPYFFMEDGKMIETPLSPERGNLLLALANSGLKPSTLDTIFQKTIFRNASFRNAILDSTYLHNVQLIDADFSNADLIGTDLSGADLRKAKFKGSSLRGADLSNSYLYEVDFSEANLIGAKFDGASFGLDHDRLTDHDLTKNHIYGEGIDDFVVLSFSAEANFRDAVLIGVDLSRLDLSGTNFNGADLMAADLSGGDFGGANLSNANLDKANLSGTHFFGANLRGANFNKANLRGANLSGADLYGAINLNSEMLKSCASIYGVRNLPDDLATILKREIENKPTITPPD